MPIGRLLVCLIVFTSLTQAENTPGGPDPATIEHKVQLKAETTQFVRFKAERNRLLEPQTYKGKDTDPSIVKIELITGGPVPGRVLVVHNHFGRTLNFRVLERLEGKREFAKLGKNVIKVGPGKSWCEFWPTTKPIAEAVLYQFSLSDEPLEKD